jgi:hypothetical protein
VARPKINDGLTVEERRQKRIAEDPEYAARYAETRRRAALAYYHRNRERVNREANERAKAKRAAEGRSRGPTLTPAERLARNAERRAAKRRAAGIPEKVSRTPEERREYARQWAERNRRNKGAVPRVEYLSQFDGLRATRPLTAPTRVIGAKGKSAAERDEILYAGERGLRERLAEARASVTGELAELVQAQEKEDYFNGRYAQHAGSALSLDARVFDNGEAWSALPKALIEPDFVDDLLERI